MAGTELERNVSHSYDENSQRYFDHVRDELEQVSVDRAALQLFAEMLGPGVATLDAGCGPGHITAFLASRGLSVSGVDISPALIDLAKASFPGIAFQTGQLANLPLDDSSVQAVVSRHSVIHTGTEGLGAVFSEFARVLTPGGRLFLSFFATNHAGEHGQAFDHAVCTAYQLDPDLTSTLLASHGLEEEIRLVRRPHPSRTSDTARHADRPPNRCSSPVTEPDQTSAPTSAYSRSGRGESAAHNRHFFEPQVPRNAHPRCCAFTSPIALPPVPVPMSPEPISERRR